MSEIKDRPFSVTLVVAVIFISGILGVVAGFMRIFGWGVDEAQKNVLAGSITIAIGVIYLLVANAVARGSGFARLLVAVVTVINIGLAIWVMFITPGRWLDSLILIFLGLVVLALLYNGRAREFFGR
ncbi:MAG: hypothetical protein Q8M17_16835 [Actinomycetota bacterium]|nr:hypothetical protein [Actinomycetota bacterium]